MIRFTLFGPFRATWNGKLISFPTRSTIALVAFLLLERHTPHPRSHLATLLWPDTTEEKGRRNLRQTLLRLRNTLPNSPDGEFPILVEHNTLQWNPAYPAEVDVFHFERAMGEAEPFLRAPITQTPYPAIVPLQTMTEVYAGNLLLGFELLNDFYAEWLQPWRTRYQRGALMALARLAEYYAYTGQIRRMEELARRQLQIDPDSETAHGQLMQAYLARQEYTAIVKHYKMYEAQVREYGGHPSPLLRRLYQQAISALEGNVLRPQPVPHNLPNELTPFYGRQEEIHDLLMRLVAPDQRLITLTGLGGIGKTRLALAAARHFTAYFPTFQPRFPGGVWFVSLADVQEDDEETIARAILQSCRQIPQPGESAFATVVRHFNERPCLLILDNLEHLPGAQLAVLNFLQAIPGLKVLATSRQPLGLQTEVVRRLEGLPVPHNESEVNVPSVRLFLERLQRVNSDFQLTPDTIPHVVRICRALDGWPLALELTASWGDRLPIEHIAHSVAENMSALRTTMPDLSVRHCSIEATLNGSYALLTAAQQRILAGFSVFRGGCTTEAAEKVLAATAEDLTLLVHRSLLKRSHNRYTVHELIRQFAQRKLEQSGNKEAVERAHGEYYLRWLIAQANELFGPHPAPSVRRIRPERQNVEQAWQWAAEHERQDLLAAALPALVRLYNLTGWLQEGKILLQKTQAMLAPTSLAYDVLLAQAQFCLRLGEYLEVRALLKSLSSVKDLTPRQQAEYAFLWGRVSPHASESWRAYQRALMLAKKAGHYEIMAMSLTELEILSNYSGRYMAEIVELAQTINDFWIKRRLYVFFGATRIHRCHYREAAACWQKALEMSLELEDEYAVATLYNNIGDALREQGEFAEAEEAFRRALHLAEALHYPPLRKSVLEGWTRLLVLQGKHEEAVQLAQEALRFAAMDVNDEQVRHTTVLACLGHAYVGLQQWNRAREAYRHVTALLSEMPQVAMEGLAGLAYVCWRQGEVVAAHKYVDNFLRMLEHTEITGCASPRLSYERVAAVLHEMGRPQDAKRVRAKIRFPHETAQVNPQDWDFLDHSA